MTFFDIFRYAIFGLFGVGMGFMAITNVLAFKVLRPPKHLGFLWWHVISISLAFACMGLVSVERVTGQLGNPPSWRTWVTLSGVTLFAAAQIIIFRVERQRLVNHRAVQVAEAMLQAHTTAGA